MTWRQWLCLVAAVALAAALLAVFGVTLWTIVGVAVLLACPVAAAWAYVAGERELRLRQRLRAALGKGQSDEPRRTA